MCVFLTIPCYVDFINISGGARSEKKNRTSPSDPIHPKPWWFFDAPKAPRLGKRRSVVNAMQGWCWNLHGLMLSLEIRFWFNHFLWKKGGSKRGRSVCKLVGCGVRFWFFWELSWNFHPDFHWGNGHGQFANLTSIWQTYFLSWVGSTTNKYTPGNYPLGIPAGTFWADDFPTYHIPCAGICFLVLLEGKYLFHINPRGDQVIRSPRTKNHFAPRWKAFFWMIRSMFQF